MVALMGPSGSGKIHAAQHHRWSSCRRRGASPSGRTKGSRASSVVDVRRELVGWIFQDFICPSVTAIDVAMALELSGMSSGEGSGGSQPLKGVSATACTSFPTAFRWSTTTWPSPGPLLEPPVLVDEPTGNLDIASGKEGRALFKELCHDEENPISILMVTHDPTCSTPTAALPTMAALKPRTSALLGAR